MNAIKVDTTIDEALARALPVLRPLVGRRVELVVREAEQVEAPRRRLTLDELLAFRVEAPPGAAPLSDDDIEQAIIAGALDGNI